LPKIMHSCCDVPLIAHVVARAVEQKCAPVVVVLGPGSESVQNYLSKRFPNAALKFAIQTEALGTGDAARVGLTALGDVAGKTLLLYGDTPLLSHDTLTQLRRQTADVAFVVADVDQPTGYGRVIQRDGRWRIVEDKDASPEEKQVRKINAGVYWCDAEI